MSDVKPFCPYVGLQPFTEEQRDFFFGRARDIRGIASNLYASPLTVLYGDSGVGKSSVLLAGVVPRLKSELRTAVVVFREWHQPNARQFLKSQCLKAVAAARGKPLEVDLKLPLDDFLLEIASQFQGTTLVLLDQFEEYFLYNTPSPAEDSFDAELARAINREEVEANFLISLRDDGLAKLDRFRARIPHLLGNTLRLRHLDLVAAEEAIRGPLRVWQERSPEVAAPANIEDDLVRAVLAEVQRGRVILNRTTGLGRVEPERVTEQIETPFLQMVMTRLWDEEVVEQSRVLRHSTLERLGGATNIARTYLDGVMEKLDPNPREVCFRFFDRLVTPSGGKIAYSVDDLTKYAGDLGADVPGVLKALTESRILRSIAPATEEPGVARYEIFHDVLGAAILDWRRRFLAEKVRVEAQRKAAIELEAQRQEMEKARELCEERARVAEERLQAARKMRVLTHSIYAAVALMLAAAVLAWASVSRNRVAVQQRLAAEQRALLVEEKNSLLEQQMALAEQGKQQAEASSKEADEKKQAAEKLAEEANKAAKSAQEDAEQARKANQDVIGRLQAQLDEARGLIESYSKQAGNNAAQANAFLEQAKKAQADLETARTNAKELEAKAVEANRKAEETERRLRIAEAVAAVARGGAEQNKQWNDVLKQMPRAK